MQKDVIYIDTEDDITAIIGKVRASEHKIVALVPPKRIGAIQSAVNLKLVHRATEQANKRLVIISNNAALAALAGSAGIPVAKNLQSKPEIAEIPALDIDDGDDIIDGSELISNPETEDSHVESVATPSKTAAPNVSSTPSKAALGATALAARNKVKIPNFDKFRKKLFFIILAVVLLVGFLIWAIIYAPAADIVVTARTSDVTLNTKVKLGDALTTSLRDGTVKSMTKTMKADVSVPFEATGTKNVGEKASGSVVMTACVTSFPPATPADVPVGTAVTSGGNQYVTNTTASFTAVGYCGPATKYVSNKVAITASEGGVAYNVSGASFTVDSKSGISASGSASGGTDKEVTIVQQSDVDSVSDKVVSDAQGSSAKKALVEEFGKKGYIILDASFKSDNSAVKPSPAVGEEAASGKGTLGGSVTYSLVAVQKNELGTLLTKYFEQQIDGQSNQKVYKNGADDTSFTNVDATDGGFTANITTNGKIGPKIDEDALKKFSKGKRVGEIQDYVRNINGVEDVDVQFSPFWVNKAPNNVDKIRIEFKVNG